MNATYTTSTNDEARQQQAIERAKEEKALTVISKYLDSEIVQKRFATVLGEKNAAAYAASVMITVKDSYSLQKCTPESIYTSALRAATLRLSTDPATGQAYMVAYGARATLIVGYKGLYDMAVRTGRYRYINVSKIFEGQEVEENQITGFHSISGKRTSDKIIGWLGAFEMNPARGQLTGFGKTFYMTVEELDAHGLRYAPSYGHKNKKGEHDSLWQTDPQAMYRKTVLRLMLRKWGYLDPADVQVLNDMEEEAETLDLDPETGIYNPDPEIPEIDASAEEHKRTTEENLRQLGFS